MYDLAMRGVFVSDNPHVLLKLADQYVTAGARQDAIETYLEVARLFHQQRAFAKAIAIFKQVLKLDPDRADIRVRIAGLHRELGIPEPV